MWRVPAALLLFGEGLAGRASDRRTRAKSEANDLACLSERPLFFQADACTGFCRWALAMRLVLPAVAAMAAVAMGVCVASSTMPRRRSVAVAAMVTTPVATSADDSIAVAAMVAAPVATGADDGSEQRI